ncbi:hypothetical protein ACPB8Q_05815 [Methanocaldococcus indicus]|uniref:hypothetical protein n=1 Tax=Methanocaldococcus indicus TaxID=213231 RepID=UPI003C6D6D7E
MNEYEFFNLLYSGNYYKLAKEIKKNKNLSKYLETLFLSDNIDDFRRALTLLKRLDDEIVLRYIKYVLEGLNYKNKFIYRESLATIKRLTKEENDERAILKLTSYKSGYIVYYYLLYAKPENIFYKALLKDNDSFDKAIKNLLDEYPNQITKALLKKLYSNDLSERKLAINIILKYLDKLDKNYLRENLDILLLGDSSKYMYKKLCELFEKLNINTELDEKKIIELLNKDEKRALKIIERKEIKITIEFYKEGFLKKFLYVFDENTQFVGVKLISLLDNSKFKIDLLFKFLTIGNGKAKTAAINELKKIGREDKKLLDYILNRAYKHAKTVNPTINISSLRILKEFCNKDMLPFLIEKHKKTSKYIDKLEEEKFLGGFRHMLYIEDEIKKCNTILNLIEEIIAKICLENNIHYESLNIKEKLGYDLYVTISLIGEKNINLIDVDKFLDELKKNGELIYFLDKLIKNLDYKYINKVLNIIDNIKIENTDILNASKINIYAMLNLTEKLGEIIELANGYYSNLAFVNAIERFYSENILNNDDLELLVPKMAELLSSNNRDIRKRIIKFFKNYQSPIILPILISELKFGEKNDILEIIYKTLEKYPNYLRMLEEFLNSDKRKYTLEILHYISRKNPDLLNEFIYILAMKFPYLSNEEKILTKKILKNIAKDEYKILEPILKY